jgi:hypothetical protein
MQSTRRDDEAPARGKTMRSSTFGVLSLALVAGTIAGTPLSAAPSEAQTFVPFVYVDPFTKLEAFRCLVPKGWKVEGQITWEPNPALPATSRFRFHDPRSVDEMNLVPTRAFFWTNNVTFLRTNPPGTRRFNTLVAKPVDLEAAFGKVGVPGARGTITSVAITERKKVPELAALAKGQPVQGLRASSEAGKIRVTYQEGGEAIEEEIYAAVANFAFDLPGSGFSPGYFIDYWYIDYVFSFKAEKGKLTARSKLFQTMIYSMKVNPKWFAKVVHTKEALFKQAIQGVKAAGNFGTIVASAGTNLREDQMKDWERRQTAQERVVQSQSDNIRGVERFRDPHADKEVELPSGYGHAWANNLGEYIVTESPSFNPNVGSNLHWEAMPVAK